MMELLKGHDEHNSFISEFKDPFKSDKCDSIMIYVRKSNSSKNGIRMTSWVEFKNGNTSGKQQIEAEDFPSLIKKTEEFIKSLK